MIKVENECFDDETVECDEATENAPKKPKRYKPKVTVLWPPKDIRLLISAIERHPIIWNYACPDHKNLRKREVAWKKVNAIFGNKYDVPNCKAKWSNVKTAYQKVLKKFKTTTESEQANSLPQPSWAYWAEMQFVNQNESGNSNLSISADSVQSPSNFSESSSCSTLAYSDDGMAESKRAQNDPLVPTKSAEVMAEAMEVPKTRKGDEWETVGSYLACQLRRVAQKNNYTAQRIHSKLMKALWESLDEFDETQNVTNKLS